MGRRVYGNLRLVELESDHQLIDNYLNTLRA